MSDLLAWIGALGLALTILGAVRRARGSSSGPDGYECLTALGVRCYENPDGTVLLLHPQQEYTWPSVWNISVDCREVYDPEAALNLCGQLTGG